MIKKMTCGVILEINNMFLICHPTGGNNWSVPKGICDKGETFKQAAVREVFEETNLKIDINKLKFIIQSPYTKEKDICLFLYKLTTFPDINELKCTSYFNYYGTPLPEVDKYKFINLLSYNEYLNKKQIYVFNEIFNEKLLS